ncbi:MAG: DUF3784 domain-containing protein [Lachnospiraceae bacterium]|nr:DUF3784 domain-containing protein [Lachnospiraceae bacterium]
MKMICAIIVGIIGILLVVLGWLLWKRQKISLLHSYHYDQVSEEDKKLFCTISGIGVFFIGIGAILTAVIIGITESAWSFFAFAIGFIVGLAMLIYAGLKYNH